MKLLKKFGAFSIGPIVGAFLGFITVPLITYFISTDEYGRCSMFTLAQSTISMLIYLGLDQAFVREFNQAQGQVTHVLANAIRIPLCAALTVDLVIVFCPHWVSALLFDTPDETLAVYALALMLPFMIMENFGLLKIRMEERGVQYSCFTILLKLLTLVLTVLLFMTYEKSFRSAIYAIALSEILTGLSLYFFSLRSTSILREPFDRPLLRRMLRFGLPLLPASLMVWALTSMDKIMLRTLCTYSELGLYSAAFKIVNVLGVVQSCFTLFWAPLAYRWYEEKKETRYFDAVNELVSCVMCAMCLGILLCKNVVAVILGQNFAKAIYIFPFIMLHPIMYTMSETTAMGIGFSRKTGYNIVVSALSGGTNILLNYLLIPMLDGKGAALATGISYMVFFWGRTLISRKIWYPIHLTKFVIYTALILVNCYLHTFTEGCIPYFVSLVSLLALVPINWKPMKSAVSLFRLLEKPENNAP